jgi:hypothetical protein
MVWHVDPDQRFRVVVNTRYDVFEVYSFDTLAQAITEQRRRRAIVVNPADANLAHQTGNPRDGEAIYQSAAVRFVEDGEEYEYFGPSLPKLHVGHDSYPG